MQSFSTEQIISRGKELGFHYKSFNFSISGKYKSSDAIFNHYDIPHFNHLHENLAGGYGNEGVYYGDVGSFIRYYKFLGVSFPILTLLKGDGKNRILEIYSFFCFQFLKLNEGIDIDKGCLSKITYHVGCKNKILLTLFAPFFKKLFNKSFDDYRNDDHPFLNRRANLRHNGFIFDKDNLNNYSFADTLNITKQNCFYDLKNSKKDSLTIKINELKDDEIKKFNDFDIMSFQVYKNQNLIMIYPVVCPHEGGFLGLENKVGHKNTLKKFKRNGCKATCNVHNRKFDPIITINLNDNKNLYNSNFYEFKILDEKLIINLKDKIDNNQNQDWSK